MAEIGRFLLIAGLIMALTGLLLLAANRFFPWLGNLPGDVRYESDNVKIFIPLGTMILISVVGTIVLNVLIRLFRR